MMKHLLFATSICAILSVLTAQSNFHIHIQPITPSVSPPFAQLVQGQQPQLQQSQQPLTTTSQPGTVLLTTFPNGTSKATFVNGTTVQPVSGIGYLVLDPSASSTIAPNSAPVSTTVVNTVYEAIAIAIGITIPPPLPFQTNDTNENITIPVPSQPNTTEPGGPDEQCLFDPSLPHCTPVDGECPTGFGMNEDEQCFPLGGCPDGYHSVEDDETGTCYPDDIPCPDDQVMSEEGNYCVVPEEESELPVDCQGMVFIPEAVPPECVPQFQPIEDDESGDGDIGSEDNEDNNSADEDTDDSNGDQDEPSNGDDGGDEDGDNGGGNGE